MHMRRNFVSLTAALVLVGTVPALAQLPGGGGDARGTTDFVEQPQNRDLVRVSTVPVGRFCARVTQVVGLDRRTQAVLYQVAVRSEIMTSIGVMAYENALASARDAEQARAALTAAARDAAPYRRSVGDCG